MFKKLLHGKRKSALLNLTWSGLLCRVVWSVSQLLYLLQRAGHFKFFSPSFFVGLELIVPGGTIMTKQPALTADEQKFNDIWNEHLRAEFSAHSADETLATMVANPRINQVPVMIGGDGTEQVYEFYAKYFLPQIPPDTEVV